MKINTKKIVKHGIEGRIFLSFLGCEVKSDLPDEYFTKVFHCFAGERDDNDNVIYISEGVNLVVSPDVFYSENSYQNIVKNIRKCGETLSEITKERAEKWHGEEEVII